MAPSALTELSVAQAAEAIAAHRLSPVELTLACLERIERLNPALNAYLTVTSELALEQARAAAAEIAAGHYRGPLHGVPFALKDLYATRGVRTTGGSRLFSGWVPEEDATVTARLRAAGAVLLGKLNTHELAFGVTTNNPHFGATRNPWNRERIPGGSSGGSGAAVAAGLAPLAMGTDTGGSIRIPASLCGVVGLKPTYGRVSTAGILPLSWSLDHAGPLTRTVADAALVLNAIAGPDDRDPQTPPVPVPDYLADLGRGAGALRLGVLRGGFFDDLNPEVATAVEQALAVFRELDATVEDVPETPALWQGHLTYTEILLPEARYFHATALATRPGDFGADVLARLNRRTDITAAEMVAAMRERDAATREVTVLLRRFDALLTPATAIPAPEISDDQTVPAHGTRVLAASVLARNTSPFNVTGMPALSLPCGFTRDGLPIGLQIAGRRWDEATVLRVAAAYEQATPWHLRRPA